MGGHRVASACLSLLYSSFEWFYGDLSLKYEYIRNETRYGQTEKNLQLRKVPYIPSKFGEL